MSVDTTSPCPVCGGTFVISRVYEGFDYVDIGVWTCNGCGRMVKFVKTPGQDARKPTDETVHDGNEEVEG